MHWQSNMRDRKVHLKSLWKFKLVGSTPRSWLSDSDLGPRNLHFNSLYSSNNHRRFWCTGFTKKIWAIPWYVISLNFCLISWNCISHPQGNFFLLFFFLFISFSLVGLIRIFTWSWVQEGRSSLWGLFLKDC